MKTLERRMMVVVMAGGRPIDLARLSVPTDGQDPDLSLRVDEIHPQPPVSAIRIKPWFVLIGVVEV